MAEKQYSNNLKEATAKPNWLFKPVDIASIIFFRVGFGALMLWEVYRYISGNKIKRYWLDPQFNFPYFGLDWLKPLPGNGMHILMFCLGVLAIFIILGYLYRISAALFFLGFTYTFLLEQARYLNHLYLVCLICFLMIFIPANRSFSLDAWLKRVKQSDFAPAWALWLLRAQIGIIYIYGGIAKLNADWLQGEPLRIWLAKRSYLPVIGPYMGEEMVVYFFTYAGLVLDLAIIPLMLWKRTRLLGFILITSFHLMNSVIWTIGIFPWLGIASITIFFEPDWPRRLIKKITGSNISAKKPAVSRSPVPNYLPSKAITVFFWSYVALQVLLPLRHFLYPGNVSWTEEGHLFSWHMKLRTKRADAVFYVKDPTTNQTWQVDANAYLKSWQYKKMATHPEMIRQFAHYLAGIWKHEGFEQVEVRAHVMATLNGRNRELLIDPNANLAAIPYSIKPANWIMPLTEPLKRKPIEKNATDEPDAESE